jgi:hypothetical protein
VYVRHKYLQNKSKSPLRSAFFWDLMLHRLVVGTDVSGQHIGPIFKGQAVQEEVATLLFLMFLLLSRRVAL